MDNEVSPQVLDRQIRIFITIGFVIAAVHFAVTNMIAPATYDMGQNYFTALILTAPSFILSLIIKSLPFIPEGSNFLISNTLVNFLFIGFSSFVYGIMGGSLVSNNRSIQWIGIILLCLLLLSSCGLMMWAAQLVA